MIHFGSYKLCDDSFSAATVLWNAQRKIHQFWSVSFGGNLECTDLNMDFCGLLPPAKIPLKHRTRPLRKPLSKKVPLAPANIEQGKVDMKVIEGLQTVRPRKGAHPQKRQARVTSKEYTSASLDPLPTQWQPLSMTGSIIPGTPIKYLVDAVSKGNTQSFDKDALMIWFSEKGIKTCGNLAEADKGLWKELTDIIPHPIYNSIEYMIEQIKKATTQKKKPLPIPPPKPSSSTSSTSSPSVLDIPPPPITVSSPSNSQLPPPHSFTTATIPPPSSSSTAAAATHKSWGAKASVHSTERKQFLGSYTKKQ